MKRGRTGIQGTCRSGTSQMEPPEISPGIMGWLVECLPLRAVREGHARGEEEQGISRTSQVHGRRAPHDISSAWG